MATPYLLVFVAALVVFIMPTALSLQCYNCNNAPEIPEGTSCAADIIPKFTCPPTFDRCFTIKYTIGQQKIELRNCSTSQFCSAQKIPCNSVKPNGTECSFVCCQGELCNNEGQSTIIKPSTKPSTAFKPSTTSTPSSAVLGPALSFGAFSSALILSKILGSN
ncbi:uncharacterized protein LOC111346557 [Stylophora pistillata]|uniref:UPAR/Ly6 domain-containing protein n=1 Tax=Stylophora pistillata TaxID=50429 RepID=A0A2B4R828_STYPI|nr:uncharacterized protein LOC111346557 [Stylophora pistillata]PFX12989.1 hypothetical protein AWC38_SpisGene22974 [Stylophora pistillata]